MRRATVWHGARALAIGLQLTGAVLAQPTLDGPRESAAAPGNNDSVEAQARELFEGGLALARAERYEEARTQFLLAYQVRPHYLVLYNIAQCEMLLGHLERAAESLQRFLREGGAELTADARAAAELELSGLRERIAARAPLQRAPEPLAAPAAWAEDPAPAEAGGSALGWVLGGAGLGLLGTALGLYLWNDDRYRDWQQRDAALKALPDFELSLARDPALWARARRNNQLLTSVHRRDAVSGVAAGLGVLALGAGIWQLLVPSDTQPVLLAGPGPELSWSMRW